MDIDLCVPDKLLLDLLVLQMDKNGPPQKFLFDQEDINLCPPFEVLLDQMDINFCPPAGLLVDQTDIN